jgi:hypothetical protein
MFKVGDWVTTEFNGGVGQITDSDYVTGLMHVRWVDFPGNKWHTDGRLVPLALASTKLWRYLREIS